MLLEQLQSGELDLCLTAPAETKSSIQWKQLWNEELFVIVSKSHRLAARKNIYLEEIAKEPFIMLKKGFSLRITAEQLCKEAGIAPTIIFEGEEADTVAGLVAAGLGVSILPDLKGTDQSKIVQIPISYPYCQRTIGISWVEERYLSPAVLQFKEFILNHFL